MEERADLVGDGDAGLGGDANWAESMRKRGKERGEQGDGVVLYRCGGEAVGDDDHYVARGWMEESGGGASEGSAEVGTAEVGGAVWGGAGNGQDWGGQGGDLGA